MSQFNTWVLVLCTLLLIGCQESAVDREAEQARNTSQREADEVREQTQIAADKVRARSEDVNAEAERTKNRLEEEADAIEKEGERTADAIEAQGERLADDLEMAEDDYWRQNYQTRSYVKQGVPYEYYRPAYLFGWQAKKRYPGKSFDQVIDELEREWNAADVDSTMTWAEAQHPARDAWERAR